MGKHTYHLEPRQRFQMVNWHLKGAMTITDICRFYGIPRKTFYYWLNVWQSDPDNFSKNVACTDNTPKRMPFITDTATTQMIVRLRKKSRFGSVKLQLLLKERDIQMSASGIYKVLKREGLIKKRRKKVKKKYKKYTAFIKKPGQKVQVDVAYLPKLFGKSHRQYVYQAIDLHTRIAYSRIYPECTPSNTVEFLKRCNSFFPFKARCYQFDHGSEFTYDMLVHIQKEHPVHTYLNKQAKIPFTFSPVATPRMNGCVERLHRTWREEVQDWHTWKNPQQMHKHNRRWLKYYNQERPHFGINLLTPLQKLQSFKEHEFTRLNYSI